MNDELDILLDAVATRFKRQGRASANEARVSQMKQLFEEAVANAKAARGAQVISLAGYLAEKRARKFAMMETFNEDEERFLRSTGADDRQEVSAENGEEVAGVELPPEWGPISLSIAPSIGSGGPDQIHISWDVALHPGDDLAIELVGFQDGQPTASYIHALGANARGVVYLDADDLGFLPENLLAFRLFAPELS